MKTMVLILIAAGLAGCGANGAPVRPTTSSSISIGTNGVSAGTSVGVGGGILSVDVDQSMWSQ